MNASSPIGPLAWMAALPVPIWHVDATGVLTWCNDVYAGLYGGDRDMVINQQKILGTGSPQRVRLTRDGVRRLYYIQRQDIPNGGAICVAQDITVEEQLQADMNRAQTGMRDLLSHLSTALARFDRDQRLEFYNTAFATLWGLDEAYLQQKPKWGDVLERLRETRKLPEQADFKRYKKTWLDHFTTLIDPFDDMMHLPTGQALRVLIVPNPAGGLMVTFEDVTSRLELETRYNTLLAVQRETLDHLHEGIAVFGGDGRLKLFNPSYLRLWGLNPEDLTGEPHITEMMDRLEPCFDPHHWGDAKARFLSQVLGGEDQTGRLDLMDGRLLSYRTIILPDGGVLISYHDVTDPVRVERALRDKNAALEAAERLKLDFLANMSYQLRTPLNAIMGFTEILDHQYFGPLNDKQRQYTAGLKEASEKLLNLIDDILDLSTIEAGYMKLDYDTVDVAALLQNIQTLTGEWARKEGLEVQLAVADDVGTMVADPRRLKQILINLIRNALAFSPVGGAVVLGAARDDQVMRLWVQDTGLGIDPNDQQKVLEPFARGSNVHAGDGRMGQGGAGLGLTLVKNITELHHGKMQMESDVGRGTTVTMTLPLSPGDSP